MLRPPYRFLAIGDPQTIATALAIPGGVLDSLQRDDARGSVSESQEVVVDAVRPDA